ncbi:MAG: hypothetical protein U5R30_10330 [Deltaproteobacteria bacterium]|nr:hypothetical protein [Deltaproteobacteria bacterium]
MFAYDVFKAIERVILDYVTDANDRAKYIEELKIRQRTPPGAGSPRRCSIA